MSVVDADLLALAQRTLDDELPPGFRVEIFDGLLTVNPPPTLAHAELATHIAMLLTAAAPPGLSVSAAGVGVYRSGERASAYQVPDVVVYRRPDADRLTGRDVLLAVEVVSPANRRQADYEAAVVARAGDYGIDWVLIVDPETRSVRWWHTGFETAALEWASVVTSAALWG